MSRIEWTEKTWNPVTGCTKLSPGCKNCYAKKMHKRLNAMGTHGYENPFATVTLQPMRLSHPEQRQKPTMYFVNSMSDLFHEDVPFSYVDEIMRVIRATPQHTYQILTKRAGRMAVYFRTKPVPGNAWIGVSVENRDYGLPRLIELQGINAPTRFLSCEPLLGDLGEISLLGIHWVIAGGESGTKARMMQPDWARSLRDQCQQQLVPFFFKQWGTWGADGKKRGKKANGRLLDGREWNEMPVSVPQG